MPLPQSPVESWTWKEWWLLAQGCCCSDVNAQKESWKTNAPAIISSHWISPQGSAVTKLKCKTELLFSQSCPTSYDPHGLQHARLPCPSKRQGNLLIRGQSPWAEESRSGCINGSHVVKQRRVSHMEAAGAWRQNQPCPWYVTQTFPVALFLHPSSKGDDTKVPWRVPFRNDQ